MLSLKKRLTGICLWGLLIAYAASTVHGATMSYFMQFNTGTGGGRHNTFSMYFPNEHASFDQTFQDLGACWAGYRIPTQLKVLPYPVQINYEAWFDQASASNLGENPWFKIIRLDQNMNVIQTDVYYISHVTDSNAHVAGTVSLGAYQGIDVQIETGSWRYGSIFYNDYGYGCRYKITYQTDNVPPPAPAELGVSGAITIDNKNYTKTFPVSLNWNTVTDAGSPVSGIDHYTVQYNNETRTVTTNSWTDSAENPLFPSDNNYAVTISATDKAGNTGPNSAIYLFTLDTTPPTGTAVINKNPAGPYIKSMAVTLSLANISDGVNGSGISQMCFSNDGTNYSDWEECNQANIEKNWTLVPGDGAKTVYVKFRDRLGNKTPDSHPITAPPVILDTTPPSGGITINNGAASTIHREVTLTLSATDAGSGVAYMQFSNDGINFSNPPETFTTTKSWLLSDGYGLKTVYVKYTDNAGNSTIETISDDINYESSIPPGDLSAENIRTLEADEVWSQDYTVFGRVIVPEGRRLTIAAGVKVTVDGPPNTDPYQNGLIIQGSLTVANGVTFITSRPGWMGIIVSGTAEVTGASISKAQRGLAVLDNAQVTVSSCTFSQNFAGIHIYAGHPLLSNCTFQDNTYGIKEDEGASAVVTGCVYNANKVNYYHAGGTVELGQD